MESVSEAVSVELRSSPALADPVDFSPNRGAALLALARLSLGAAGLQGGWTGEGGKEEAGPS